MFLGLTVPPSQYKNTIADIIKHHYIKTLIIMHLFSEFDDLFDKIPQVS